MGSDKPAPDRLGPDGRSPEELLSAVARRRDRAAFSLLYRHFAPRIKSYAIRCGMPAAAGEELAQEVLLAVWERAETYDPGQAPVGTWIFVLARNRRIDRLRREARPEFDPNDPALVPMPEQGADERLEIVQRVQKLDAALACLSAEQSSVLRRAYFEDKTHVVIAEEESIPLGTVKARMRLALGHLRRAMGDEA